MIRRKDCPGLVMGERWVVREREESMLTARFLTKLDTQGGLWLPRDSESIERSLGLGDVGCVWSMLACNAYRIHLAGEGG